MTLNTDETVLSNNESPSVQKELLLSVRDLCMYFTAGGGKQIKAAEHVSFDISEGEVFGLVGESGSGKSTIGKCIVGLNKPTSGNIQFQGKELVPGTFSKDIQMIFQDPMSSLNPRRKISDIIGEALDIRNLCSSKKERREKVLSELAKVGIPPELADRYPAQFSGGQRQRVGIARAMIVNPRLVVADECIAALDACVQAQVVNMLKRLQKESGMSLLFISHDLSMVKYLSDRIGVLHLGYMLETGVSDEIFEDPVHPYTKSLLRAIPELNPVIWDDNRESYDPVQSGINYGNGRWHDITDTHKVWCTDNEYEKWREKD